ncbi:hypothetical protein IAR55_004732 [Kwoniella newhampshirensis]|uniref:TatD DNase n=1 Tax=Kwoniella newhampshirensis TaxID=1651941 RepID=A0AAW0YHZ2_9TREE
MCSQHDEDGDTRLDGTDENGRRPSAGKRAGSESVARGGGGAEDDGVPDWENMVLPPEHILSHLTDAHCHPTDLTHLSEVYDAVPLGGLASMATIVDDQDRVRTLSEERGWYSAREKGKGREGRGVGVVACFGYHPWFTHLYTLSSSSSLPTKEEHYISLFCTPNSAPSSKNRQLLSTLLPYLPNPVPFEGLLVKLREDIKRSIESGRLTMLGEVGLDGSARMRWPRKAKHLHPDHRDNEQQISTSSEDKGDGAQEEEEGKEDQEEWKRLTPFKVPMSHQRAILEAQMEIAIDLGVNVSLHSVSCAGPTLDTLIGIRDQHGTRFTNRINVDLHSVGGWSPAFWTQAERNLSNLYASPSILITGRSPTASQLIRSISPRRILVESDSHDVRLSSRLVWAATEWISRCKKWNLEGGGSDGEDVPEWDFWDQEGVKRKPMEEGGEEEEEEEEKAEEEEEEEDQFDEKGRLKDIKKEVEEGETWTVKTLERNWARFMRLIED